MMGIEHEQAVDIMQKRLDSEREEREKLQAKFDEAQASSKKTIGTLEGQVAELIATVANLHRQQRESSKKFIEEQGDLKAQWASQVNRLNEKREVERQTLGSEVTRLRAVQEQVLAYEGKSALPGGEARRLLFYESMKAKGRPATAALQPDSSISWRGQSESVRFEYAPISPTEQAQQELPAKIRKPQPPPFSSGTEPSWRAAELLPANAASTTTGANSARSSSSGRLPMGGYAQRSGVGAAPRTTGAYSSKYECTATSPRATSARAKTEARVTSPTATTARRDDASRIVAGAVSVAGASRPRIV